MKHTLISIILIAFAIPCLAQWKYEGTNGQVLAFGIHDTSLYFSYEGDLERLFPYGDADTGLDFTQGNFTTFASAGPNFFAGCYNPKIGGGPCSLTTNNGSSWKSDSVIAGPVGTNGTYVFANYAYKIARSTDNGNTWQHLSYPSGMNYAGNGAVVYTCATSYWASTPSVGFWRSLDSGFTWSQLPAPFSGTVVTMGTVLLMYQNYLSGTAGANNGVLVLSKDSGMTWDTVAIDSVGIPEKVTCLATDGRNLFAGGFFASTVNFRIEYGTGVFVSTDTGKTWKSANDGLGYLQVEALAVYPYDTTLYVSTTNGGTGSGANYATYYRPIREITDTTPASVVQQLPAGDSIEIYPNPSMGTVTILAGGTSILGVSVLSVLGEDMLDLPRENEESLTFDLSKFPSGTYFIRIQTINGSVLRKITLER